MAINQIGNHKEIFRKTFDESYKGFENEILTRLAYIGEKSIETARLSGDYTDRTGNLRSSVGYIVLNEGQLWTSGGFDSQINSGTEGDDGAEDGLSAAIQRAEEFPSGYTLIVVAGMEYASYVENRDYEVLSFTEAEAKRIAEDLLSNL